MVAITLTENASLTNKGANFMHIGDVMADHNLFQLQPRSPWKMVCDQKDNMQEYE